MQLRDILGSGKRKIKSEDASTEAVYKEVGRIASIIEWELKAPVELSSNSLANKTLTFIFNSTKFYMDYTVTSIKALNRHYCRYSIGYFDKQGRVEVKNDVHTFSYNMKEIEESLARLIVSKMETTAS